MTDTEKNNPRKTDLLLVNSPRVNTNTNVEFNRDAGAGGGGRQWGQLASTTCWKLWGAAP